MVKYTYDDWWSGKVGLFYAPRFLKKGKQVLIAEWKDFSKRDQKKIKIQQEKLFLDQMAELTSNMQNDLKTRLDRSEFKGQFLTEELDDIENILRIGAINSFNGIVDLHLKHRHLKFINTELAAIRNYFNDFIVGGLEKSYDFMNSPNFPYRFYRDRPAVEVHATAFSELKKSLLDKIQNFSKQRKKIEIPLTAIARFCRLLSENDIFIRLDTENNENYCKRACQEFKLNYTDKVRQYYSDNSKKHLLKVKELIVPIIDKKTGDKLLDDLKQKYGL